MADSVAGSHHYLRNLRESLTEWPTEPKDRHEDAMSCCTGNAARGCDVREGVVREDLSDEHQKQRFAVLQKLDDVRHLWKTEKRRHGEGTFIIGYTTSR